MKAVEAWKDPMMGGIRIKFDVGNGFLTVLTLASEQGLRSAVDLARKCERNLARNLKEDVS